MDEHLTVVLLGNTGGGRSASGNTILGQQRFECKPYFGAVTRQVSKETGHVFGKQITVIDTPGILQSKNDIKILCMDVLQSSTPCLFLVVVRIGRFSEEDQVAVEAAIEVVGPEGFRNTYLLFAGGDALGNMRLEDFIHEEGNPSLQAVVKRFDGRLHLFNNRYGGQEQVQTLLEKAGHLRSVAPVVLEKPMCLEERRIILIGRPGVGKSSAGNTILGCRRFKSDCDFDLVSTETVCGSAEVDGRQVIVVDTPGLTEDTLNPEELYMEIMKALIEAIPGPHAFVIVVRIGKVSDADVRLFEILPQLFGSDALKYTMVLFTHGDELRGRAIEDKVQANMSVSKLLSLCRGRSHVFDNTQTENKEQVRRFLNEIDEMVVENGGEHCSSDMFRMTETFIRDEKNLSLSSTDSWIKRVWERLVPFLIKMIMEIRKRAAESFTWILPEGSEVEAAGQYVHYSCNDYYEEKL